MEVKNNEIKYEFVPPYQSVTFGPNQNGNFKSIYNGLPFTMPIELNDELEITNMPMINKMRKDFMDRMIKAEDALDTEISVWGTKQTLRDCLKDEILSYLIDPERHDGKSFAEMSERLLPALHKIRNDIGTMPEEEYWEILDYKAFDESLRVIVESLFVKKTI